MNSYEKLMASLDKEMQAFKDSYKSMTTTQVYNDWYIIGFYQEYYDMLTTGISGQLWLDDSVMAWLTEKENPLGFLYDQWMSCDGSFSHDWEDMLDWVNLVYREEKEIGDVVPDERPDEPVPEDKIMVAILDADYYEKHGSYPEEYRSEYAHEVYLFDTPEEFVNKWYELPEGDWYWVYADGDVICSGAIDPNDIEIFEDYFDTIFHDLDEVVDLPEVVVIKASELAIDTDEIAQDEDALADIVSDYLSDTYGYCHRGFGCQVRYNEFGEPSEFVVKDIEWDVDDNERGSLEKQIKAAKSLQQESTDGDRSGAKVHPENTI